MRIDPWSNDLLLDYEKLFKEFGMQHIDEGILARIRNKDRLWRRGIVFAHRDLDLWFSAAEKGKSVVAMSGIKPSGEFHLGSKLTAEELIFFQKEFNAKVFYAVADLEAYADNGLLLEESAELAVSNVADLLALGLDDKNAFIYKQSEERRVMNFAYLAARKTTLATLQALYGDKNMGLYFATLTQSGDMLLPEDNDFGGPKHVVVPVGIDQDPHIRLCRDLAPKFGLTPPSSTYHAFMKSLTGESKMGKRDPSSLLTLADEPEVAAKKVMSAFTGGRATVEEQKKKGGEIGKCVVFDLCVFHFEEDDKELAERKRKCLAGEIMCGQCKKEVAEKVVNYLKAHQEKKKKLLPKAKKLLEKKG